MSLVPVLDIKSGKVVMGSQGKRETYEPVSSELVDSAEPEDVLQAFIQNYEFQTVYIADIDALEDQGDNFDSVKSLSEKFDKKIMLDCGFSKYECFDSEILAYVDKFIVPTESLESLQELERVVNRHPETDFVVSVDLDQQGFISKIDEEDVHSFLGKVKEKGITEIILLDVSQVGTEKGPSDQVLSIADEVKNDFRIISGGGVKRNEHYLNFLNGGVSEVLIATSLHKEDFQLNTEL